MDATVIIFFGCSENFILFYCEFDIKKRRIFVCKMVLYFCLSVMYPYYLVEHVVIVSKVISFLIVN